MSSLNLVSDMYPTSLMFISFLSLRLMSGSISLKKVETSSTDMYIYYLQHLKSQFPLRW